MPSLKDDIQTAILGLLRAAPSVTALTSTRIYEEPPANATSPYIVAGDCRERQQVTMCSSPTTGSNTKDLLFPLHIVYEPDQTGVVKKTYFQMARAVADAVEGVVHKADLTLPTCGWTCSMCIKQDENELRDESGARMIEQIYRILCNKTDTA